MVIGEWLGGDGYCGMAIGKWLLEKWLGETSKITSPKYN